MTNPDIASAVATAAHTERIARAAWHAAGDQDLAERDAALVVVRKATELRIVLERWITARALRAALQKAG